MRPDRTVFLAGKPGSSLVYIGVSVNIRRSLAHINAKRDPGDTVELLWSARSWRHSRVAGAFLAVGTSLSTWML